MSKRTDPTFTQQPKPYKWKSKKKQLRKMKRASKQKNRES